MWLVIGAWVDVKVQKVNELNFDPFYSYLKMERENKHFVSHKFYPEETLSKHWRLAHEAGFSSFMNQYQES